MDSRSYAFGFDGSAAGVANVVLASPGRKRTSASRISPTNVEGSVARRKLFARSIGRNDARERQDTDGERRHRSG